MTARAGLLAATAGACVAALIASAARAALMALKDAYHATDLHQLALRSAARDTLEGLLWCLPAALILGWLLVRTRGPDGRRPSSAGRLLALVGVIAAYAFIVGRLPPLVFHAPGFDGGKAWAAHALGAATALTAVSVVWRAVAGSPRFVRAVSVAAVVVLLLAAFGATRSPGRRAEQAAWPGRPNVILISLDTVRADHLGCYGYEHDTTPALDAFARQAVRFERAYTPQPWTLTAHMSLLTGLTPSVHGVLEETALPRAIPTLAEAFSAAGYLTAAVLDPVVWLDARYGFARGFDVFQRPYGSAERKNAYVTRLLDDLGGGPFFLFLHYYDAHSDKDRLPYDADRQDHERFASWYEGDFSGCDGQARCASDLLKAVNAGQTSLPADVVAYVRSLYDAGLRSLDRQLGHLFDDLERRGLLADSIVIVTSDHGEAFLEHGRVLHGDLYEHTARVPLIVRTPDTQGGGAVDELASLVDVAPTLAALCVDVEMPPGQGRSFAHALGGERAPSSGEPREYVLLDQGRDTYGVHTGAFKLIRSGEGEELYDLRADPGERRNLVSEQDTSADVIRLRQLGELAAGQSRRLRDEFELGDPGQGGADAPLDPAEREVLRQLGYFEDGDR